MTLVSAQSGGSYLRAWVLHGLAEVIEEHGGEPTAYATAKGAGWVLCLGPSGGVVLDPLP